MVAFRQPGQIFLEIDVSVRLRRAIILNDLFLVKRITKNNPNALQNPDFAEKGNTSLHLAAKLGFLEIATYLVEAGHENGGISRNADWDTPLMLACEAHPHLAAMLAKKFPGSINWRNKRGVDAMMTAAKNGQDTIVATLLSGRIENPEPNDLPGTGAGAIERADVTAQDNDGNTALHYASAYGELKVIRTLLQAGASPLARNAYSWTPISYSLTVAAEVYFRNLVAEFEKRKVEIKQAERAERAKRGVGGVRLVTEDMDPGHPRTEGEPSALTPADDRSPMSGKFFPPPQMHGSPAPASGPAAASTKSESGWSFGGLRGRASSGE
ncbi:ankyrin [Xylona heveae TC161]|uniref:Ankyrin n=1 Tax=Xylona heveae (strain CBS 132557 / TC161) TaxID=1328760 RepID=A0A165G6C6_XYLHT|nr:ankyrin [Xylona heveae TC161]KZF21791.1 ankyrin [Xylona heveae TC161]